MLVGAPPEEWSGVVVEGTCRVKATPVSEASGQASERPGRLATLQLAPLPRSQ